MTLDSICVIIIRAVNVGVCRDVGASGAGVGAYGTSRDSDIPTYVHQDTDLELIICSTV